MARGQYLKAISAAVRPDYGEWIPERLFIVDSYRVTDNSARPSGVAAFKMKYLVIDCIGGSAVYGQNGTSPKV
jgi:hypothetical protein